MPRLVTVLNEGILVPRARQIRNLRIKLRKCGVGPTRLRKALRALLKYFGEKEHDDFLDADHTATLRQHIYGSMVVVEEFLKGPR